MSNKRKKVYELQRSQPIWEQVTDSPRDPESEPRYETLGECFVYEATVENTAAGRKHVREKGLTGKFRVVSVTDEFEAKAEQVTKVTFS